MIIGINGYANSGKDTLGTMLVSHGKILYNQDWEIKKLAASLKGMAALLLGVPEEKFEERDFKDSFLDPEWDTVLGTASYKDEPVLRDPGVTNMKKITAREFLIKLAKSTRERVHIGTFINALFNNYKPVGGWPEYGITEDGGRIPIGYNTIMPNWIITDVRYKNEAEYIKAKGGIIIRIGRMIAANRINGPGGVFMHESETELDSWDFDYRVSNDGTIEELYTKAEKIMKYWFNKDC